MSYRYEVTTFDVCASGFERLRNQDEFILLASITAETTAQELQEQWLSDVDHCARPDGFDYDQVRGVVETYVSETVAPLFRRRKNPFNLEAGREDIGITEDEGCTAFLYVRDADA